MVKATYKRKGCKYQCTFRRDSAVSTKLFRLLGRAGIYFHAAVFEYSTYISVRVCNLLGIQDVAEFRSSESDKAKAFLYSRSRDASPQLSLFWGAM